MVLPRGGGLSVQTHSSFPESRPQDEDFRAMGIQEVVPGSPSAGGDISLGAGREGALQVTP